MIEKGFFAEIDGFTDFAQSCDSAFYHPAPEDWLVILTDVEGSTEAIQRGRYKEVNMVGAASIAAVVNSCPDIAIPYVFGGDGATLLVPPTHQESVKRALLALKYASKRLHDLSLRVGMVPIKEITARGKSLNVAKYVMPTGFALAMFHGGGALLADHLVKHEGFTIKDPGGNDAPDLHGLSCRWQPLPARRDTMLTLLILATREGEESIIYQKVNEQLSNILGDETSPVNLSNLRYTWPTWRTLRSAMMVWRQGNVVKHLLQHIGMITLFHVLNRFNLPLGHFNVVQYREDMIANSDYQKFDDMLRMVVDCTHPQAKAMVKYLTGRYEAGEIVFGTHMSDSALMTCFVQTTESDGHIHFIDGNDGGYALAATQLKQQLAEKHRM